MEIRALQTEATHREAFQNIMRSLRLLPNVSVNERWDFLAKLADSYEKATAVLRNKS